MSFWGYQEAPISAYIAIMGLGVLLLADHKVRTKGYKRWEGEISPHMKSLDETYIFPFPKQNHYVSIALLHIHNNQTYLAHTGTILYGTGHLRTVLVASFAPFGHSQSIQQLEQYN